MSRISKILIVAAAWLLASATLPAQVINLLHTFSAAPNGLGTVTNLDGAQPHSDLVLSGTTLYGTALLGGSNGLGVIFSMNTDGAGYAVLHTFTGGADGATPGRSLLLANGTLYGVTGMGTNLGPYGAIFSVETNGSNFALIHNFDTNTAGSIGEPNGGLVLCSNTLYGTAFQGGITNAGSIFSVDTDGNDFQLLHLFKIDSDGDHPLCTLVLSSNVLYGTASFGGTNVGTFGTVFSITTAGTNFTVLHDFGESEPADGSHPNAGMLLSGGTLYGTTSEGGTNNHGTVFAINTDGSSYAVLHSFAGLGELPGAPLLYDDGTLYGTSAGNGTTTQGAVFSVATNGGDFTLLQTFPHLDSGSNFTNAIGSLPQGGLAMAENTLYGTTSEGGICGNGTVFSLAIEPTITGLNLVGSNVVLNAMNGFAGNTWTVLASGDLTTPLAAWIPIATNTLTADGNFSITATNAIDSVAARQFYVLQMQ